MKIQLFVSVKDALFIFINPTSTQLC